MRPELSTQVSGEKFPAVSSPDFPTNPQRASSWNNRDDQGGRVVGRALLTNPKYLNWKLGHFAFMQVAGSPDVSF